MSLVRSRIRGGKRNLLLCLERTTFRIRSTAVSSVSFCCLETFYCVTMTRAGQSRRHEYIDQDCEEQEDPRRSNDARPKYGSQTCAGCGCDQVRYRTIFQTLREHRGLRRAANIRKSAPVNNRTLEALERAKRKILDNLCSAGDRLINQILTRW